MGRFIRGVLLKELQVLGGSRVFPPANRLLPMRGETPSNTVHMRLLGYTQCELGKEMRSSYLPR
jgi:hypothetical protein